MPAPPKNEAFDFVASAWPGRAVYAKSSVSPDSIVAASEALAQIEARTADRVMTIFNWVMQFSAQRAEQKAKLSAQRAEQKAKLSTQRAEQMAMLIDRTAHLFSAMRAQRMAQQTKVRSSRTQDTRLLTDRGKMAEPKAAAPMQRALARAPYVKAAYAVAALAAVGAGVAVASQRAHGMSTNHSHINGKPTWLISPSSPGSGCPAPQVTGHRLTTD